MVSVELEAGVLLLVKSLHRSINRQVIIIIASNYHRRSDREKTSTNVVKTNSLNIKFCYYLNPMKTLSNLPSKFGRAPTLN